MREVRFEVESESVFGRLHEPEGSARGQIVLVHGLLSQGIEFADAPAQLARRGWRALVLDQRGFGASGGERGLIDEARATEDVLGAVRFLRGERPDLPVGLVGHSMGALFVLRAMAADPEVRGAVLAAPMRTIRAELGEAEFLGYRVGNALSRLKQRVGMGPLVVPYRVRYSDLFDDPDAVARSEREPFLAARVSLANYDALMGMDSARHAARVKQPVLVVLAENDRVIRNERSREVFQAIAGPKELVSLRCGHSLFGDFQAQAAVAHVDRWMGRHLTPVS